jgi:hypothetical protein
MRVNTELPASAIESGNLIATEVEIIARQEIISRLEINLIISLLRRHSQELQNLIKISIMTSIVTLVILMFILYKLNIPIH